MKILSGRPAVDHVLQRLKDAGFYTGDIDGSFGPLADTALEAVLELAAEGLAKSEPEPGAGGDPAMAWGGKVSRTFRERVRWIANDLGGFTPDDLMDCMGWESDGTFRADIRNMAGSGATGLIQHMPMTALPYFHSAEAIKAMTSEERAAKGRAATDKLAAMTPEDQLNYVYRYFRPFKGRLNGLGDLYMAILWPRGVGQPDSFVLWDKATWPTTYRQNAGLDINKDGTISRGEALAKVREKAKQGRTPAAYWPGA